MSNPAVVAEVERVAQRAGSPKATLRVVRPGRAAKRARWGVEFVHKVAQRNHYGIHDGKAIGTRFPGRIRRGI